MFRLFGFLVYVGSTMGCTFKFVVQEIILMSILEKLNTMNLLLYMDLMAALILLPLTLHQKECGVINVQKRPIYHFLIGLERDLGLFGVPHEFLGHQRHKLVDITSVGKRQSGCGLSSDIQEPCDDDGYHGVLRYHHGFPAVIFRTNKLCFIILNQPVFNG